MTSDGGEVEHRPAPQVSLGTIGKQWLRLGCTDFGGRPTHIVLLRRMCVEERQWIEAKEFEDATATTNLLPGPASTQLAMYCAWRLQGAAGPSWAVVAEAELGGSARSAESIRSL